MSSATVGALRVELSADSAQFKSGLNEASGLAQKFGSVLGVAGGAVAAFGAAALASVAIVVAQMRKVANEADELGKAAQKVGLMTEELSALKYTAGLAGVGFDALQTGLVRLTKSMSEVAKGGEGDAAKAFDVLSISVQNADGSLKSSQQVMEEVADKFEGFKDGAEKTALALAIFGKAGADLIPLLNQGGEAIRKSNDEAKDFGATMSSGLSKASEQLNDNLSRLGTAFQGIWIAIANRLIPIFADWSESLVSTVKEMRLFEIAGNAIDVILRVIGNTTTWVTGQLSGLGSIMEGVVRAWQEKDWAQLTKGVEGYRRAVEAAALKVAAANAVIPMDQLGKDAAFLDAGSAFRVKKPPAPTIASATTTAGGTTPESEYDAEKARIEGKLTAIREGIMSEQELKAAKYEADQQLIDEAYQKEMITAQEHNTLMQGIERDHQAALAQIRSAADQQTLNNVSSTLSNLGKATESWGKKNNMVAKGLAIASGLISTFSAALKAMDASATMGPAAAFASYAAVFAKGMATIASLTAVNPSGGGGSRSAPAGGGYSAPAEAAPAQAGRMMYVNIQGTTLGREQMRDFMEQANVFFKDGGGKMVFA